MHSRDITLLIVYCNLISCTTPAYYFYQCAMVRVLVEIREHYTIDTYVHIYYNLFAHYGEAEANLYSS